MQFDEYSPPEKWPPPMLPDWAISLLRCPETGQRLELKGGVPVREDGKVFPCLDGIASLVYPQTLQEADASWNRFYDALAPFYDFSERVLGRLLTGIDMVKGRAEIAALAGLEPGSQVLEVSPGPGVFHPLLRKALGPSSHIVAADLSLNMLRECRRQHGALEIALIQANALHLPFADEAFDALFHFGGVNLFSDPNRALSEFVRVVRKGGRIVWGDECMSERFSHPIGRRVLPRMNPGFRKTPPAPPCEADVLDRYEVYGGLGYLFVAKRRA
jgi:ubiquinone/menaquinone biosynthesis C-methylase UbiE